jgi:hypothetical protein
MREAGTLPAAIVLAPRHIQGPALETLLDTADRFGIPVRTAPTLTALDPAARFGPAHRVTQSEAHGFAAAAFAELRALARAGGASTRVADAAMAALRAPLAAASDAADDELMRLGQGKFLSAHVWAAVCDLRDADKLPAIFFYLSGRGCVTLARDVGAALRREQEAAESGARSRQEVDRARDALPPRCLGLPAERPAPASARPAAACMGAAAAGSPCAAAALPVARSPPAYQGRRLAWAAAARSAGPCPHRRGPNLARKPNRAAPPVPQSRSPPGVHLQERRLR